MKRLNLHTWLATIRVRQYQFQTHCALILALLMGLVSPLTLANECDELVITAQYSESINGPINVTNLPLGSVIATVQFSYQKNQCARSAMAPHPPTSSPLQYIVSDIKNQTNRSQPLALNTHENNKIALFFRQADGQQGWLQWQKTDEDTHQLILKNKPEGLTVVDPADLFYHFNQLTIIDALPYSAKNKMTHQPKVINNLHPIQLLNLPSCSASITNIDFGNILLLDINNPMTKKQMEIMITCNQRLPSFTMVVMPAPGQRIIDSQKGIFSSSGNAVNFQVNFVDDADFGNQGNNPTELGKRYTAARWNSKAGSFYLNITPIFLPSQSLKPGVFRSALNINLAFQ